MYDITAIGELLIDLGQHGISENGSVIYEANPGGAPCNVLAMATKLGCKTAFIGKVGKDAFGDKLKKTIDEIGIDSAGLKIDDDVHTTLAIVSTDEAGDRSFSFYREPGADMMLTADEVNTDIIKNSKIFHFGTLSMTHDGVFDATVKAIDAAVEANCIISFDPNLRKPLWKDLDKAKEKMLFGCSKCNILKIEDDELTFMTGRNTEDGIAYLKEKFSNIDLILLTAGSKGCTAYFDDMVIPMGAYLQKATIDTTGAGDTFFGSCLSFLSKWDKESLGKEQIIMMLQFASAAASIITTRKGTLCVMPSREEVTDFISNFK